MDSLDKITEVELIYRNAAKASERPRVVSSKVAYKILLSTWDMNKIELQEQFRVMFIDGNNSCMGVATLATGGRSKQVRQYLNLCVRSALNTSDTERKRRMNCTIFIAFYFRMGKRGV